VASRAPGDARRDAAVTGAYKDCRAGPSILCRGPSRFTSARTEELTALDATAGSNSSNCSSVKGSLMLPRGIQSPLASPLHPHDGWEGGGGRGASPTGHVVQDQTRSGFVWCTNLPLMCLATAFSTPWLDVPPCLTRRVATHCLARCRVCGTVVANLPPLHKWSCSQFVSLRSCARGPDSQTLDLTRVSFPIPGSIASN
jgi:hypothetical protein